MGGGLLTRTFLILLHTDPGFRPAQSIAVCLSIPSYRYGVYEEGANNLPRRELYGRLEQSFRSIANVEEAGLTRKLPLRQFWNPDGVSIEGRPPAIRSGIPTISKRWGMPMHGDISLQIASPGYFAALGIPLMRGRMFDDRDRADLPLSAVINQAMVRKFFPNEDPLGRRITVDRGTSFLLGMTIVGVVGDARLDGMDQLALPEVFADMAQLPSADAWIVARARGDADSIGRALRKAVHDIDPEIGIVESATMTGIVGDSLWRERLSAGVVGLFAALALSISAGGLYAVVSHAVVRRTQELGVRLALGADSVRIAQTVLGHGLRVTGLGITVGTPLTIVAGRLLAAQAFQIGDLPWMLSAVATLFLILTLVACWVPLRRALAVDPVAALRAD